MTDGGIQDDDVALWMNNLFHGDIYKMYCSSIVSREVQCLGVHKSICNSKLPVSSSQIKSIPANISCELGEGSSSVEEKSLRTVWYHDESVQSVAALSTPQVKQSVVITKRIMVGRMGFVSCPVMSGAIFIGNVNVQCSGPTSQVAKELYNNMQSQHLVKLSSIVDMESLLCACSDGILPAPKRVVWDVMGQWAEFGGVSEKGGPAMAPVVWFRFCSRSEFVKNKRSLEGMLKSSVSCKLKGTMHSFLDNRQILFSTLVSRYCFL